MVLRFVTLIVLIMSVGCSESSDIQLRDPLRPAESQEPGSAGDGSTSAPKDPTAKEPGTATPQPIPTPAPVRYRILCEDRYPPFINAISSMASASGFGAGIEITEFGTASGDLEFQENPQVVSLPKFGLARLVFSARRNYRNPLGESYTRNIFAADADITLRTGRAKFIANEVPVSYYIRSAATKESFTVRTFGVSDGGKYLLIGQGDGYRILDSNTLASLAVLKVGAADSNVNPSLREADMVFSVSTANGTSFTSKLYSVGLAPRGGLKSLTAISTTSYLRRPLAAVGNKAGESFASLDTSNRIVLVSPLKPEQRVAISKLPLKGRLTSSAAFWRDPASRGLRAAIVFENVVAQSGGISARYKIEQVFVRALEINESKLSADSLMPDFDYPLEIREAIESGIGAMSGAIPGVRDLRAAADGSAVFGLFPGSLSAQIYRLTSTGLVRVSQEICGAFSIGREL